LLRRIRIIGSLGGGNEVILAAAVKITKPGGNISNVNYFGSGEALSVSRLEWGCGMAHKTIRGGLCPGGRLRMEKLASLVVYKRVDPSNLLLMFSAGLKILRKR